MDGLELVHVTVLHRHGARSPVLTSRDYCQQLNLAWTDCQVDIGHRLVNLLKLPWLLTDKSDTQQQELQQQMQLVVPGQCFFGQLTHRGKAQLASLGRWLRNRYISQFHLLNPQLDPKEIYLRSTNYVRTIESLQYLVHGLYPPPARSESALHLDIYPHATETMIPQFQQCAALASLYKLQAARMEITYAQDIDDALGSMAFLGLVDSSPISKSRRVYRMYDMLSSLQGNKLDLPPGISSAHIQTLECVVVKIWGQIYAANKQITSLAIGRFLPEWTAPMVQAAKASMNKASKPQQKFAIFSGHDATIEPVLAAMETQQTRYPGYASNVLLFTQIILELFKKQNESYVRMLYDGTAVDIPACAPQGKHLTGVPSMCTLEAFMYQVNSMTPTKTSKLIKGGYDTFCNSTVQIEPDWD